MLTTKTVCRPGSFVEVVPAGLLATLQYNQHGLLESIKFGYDEDSRVADKKEFDHLAPFAPATINLVGGTSWVLGVFYSPSALNELGILPECTYYSILESSDIEFYAGNVKSLAANFAGSITTRNWLNVNKFNVLPGMVVPLQFTEDSLTTLIESGGSTFRYPYIAGYMIFEGTEFRFSPQFLVQDKVRSVYKKLTPYGYLMGDIKLQVSGSITVNWSDVVKWNLQAETAIVFAQQDVVDIVYSYKTDQRMRTPISAEMYCPICKKAYTVPENGPVCCDDPTCVSRMYPHIQHMLSVFNMPEMKESRFMSLSSNHQILCLTDVLLLEEYSQMKIEATIAKALFAVTPTEVCPDETFFIKFADACNNTVETVMYYVNNPARIMVDLNFVSLNAQKFAQWLQLDGVPLLIQTILSHVKIIRRTKKFDGAPIFRNVRIAVTGLFKRGTYETIASILESYSGTVVPAIEDDLPNFLVVGGLNTNIDGAMIQKARKFQIPMYGEDEFFARYEIDNDLAQANLL